MLSLPDKGLDTVAAGRRIAAMTEEEKNAVKMYVWGCVVAVLFCSPLFLSVCGSAATAWTRYPWS